MKKTVAAVMCCCMLSGIAAFADISKTDNTVTVKFDKISQESCDPLMYVFYPDAELKDGTVSDSDLQHLFRVERKIGVTDFETSFKMQDYDAEGVYRVIIGGFDGERITGSFVHLKSETDSRITAELNAAESSVELKAVYDKYNDAADLADYGNPVYMSYSEKFFEVLYDNFAKSFEKSSDARTAFDKTCVILEISSLDGENLIKAIDTLSLTDSEFYKNNSAAVAKIYAKYKDKGETVEKLKKSLREAIAVTEVNLSDSENVLDAVKRYPDIFNVNFDGDFKKVSEAQMAKALYNKDFVTADSVTEAFNRRLAYLLSDTKTPSSPGGGGGGGGASGGAAVSPGTVPGEVMEQLAEKNMFSDIDDCPWAREYIEGVSNRQIMIGDGGLFRPNDNLKREELVKIIVLARELKDSEKVKTFDDVSENDWFYSYVQTAVSAGIVNGVSESVFGAGADVTRQEAAAMLYRAFKSDDPGESESLEFSDGELVSDYARGAVSWFAKNGIISGFPDGTFRPHDNLTRAQAAKIIYELISREVN